MTNPLTSVEARQEVLSLALEERSKGGAYQDLVSNSNPLLHTLKRKGKFKAYSGPAIRERLLYNKTGSIVWYNGYDFLNPVPTELFNDAVYTPKMAAVAVTLANEDILNNEGENQLMDILEAHIGAAESELEDEVDIALQGNGTRFGGKELGGLQLALPTVVDSGTYGGISRVDNALWRTSVFDANSFLAGYTQVNGTSIRPMLNSIMMQRTRSKKGADLFLMSPEHYAAMDASMTPIQRINDNSGVGKAGFSGFEYIGPGRKAEIVLGSGIGSNMPANVTYGIDTDNLWLRYHPERNFNKIGKSMMPLNQDATVQYIGFMGELTMTNPLFMWKLIDSNTGS